MFEVNTRGLINNKHIAYVDFTSHLLLLAVPLSLFIIIFTFAIPNNSFFYLSLFLVCGVYTLSYGIAYHIHKQNILRLWQHLEQVIHINDTTYELVNLSSQYNSENAFLDALLQKAVIAINDAEMGSMILVDKNTSRLQFESVVGLDLEALRKINFTLEETFQFRSTNGRCDKAVVINNMKNINAKSTLTSDDQHALLHASTKPICSTLSSPIRIDGKLYGMMNLDSSKMEAFGDYDINLVNILTSEAANAISLYQKSKKIEIMADYDGLTELYNRKKFDSAILQWQHEPDLASYIIILDMDNLKPLNDQHGHQAGDNALKAFAQSLKKLWHSEFLLARYGGDEFVALCRGPIEIIEKQISQLQQDLAALSPGIHFSFGIAHYVQDWASAFKQADNNMYIQKGLKKRPAAEGCATNKINHTH
ncbi:MAG: GGDEF domain-containing protein [Shewanella vesiculosa]|nr:GGDEF domain-containing protein [Shewanella vesiculosa]NCQ47041.1 GGDEF domain-containing protein [Shewanella frigidimarina]NCP37998.1 GGDEF domain-containing protein [Shewanella vesiculosa]NCP71147.1 GGDEF domain-containing protein [Shewanella vesiculosa]NCP75645.1 GGDEF domain-containing protein [Shewanella vesiculosa]